MKFCPQCRENKEFFNRESTRPDGLARICRDCARVNNRKAYLAKAKPLVSHLSRRGNEKPACMVCRICDEEKPYTKEFFELAKHTNWGLTYQCRACRNKKARLKGYRISAAFAKKYGMTRAQAESLARLREISVCACCGSSECLCVDHCHATGKIRGILCSACNKALGLMEDNPALLRQLAEYIETIS